MYLYSLYSFIIAQTKLRVRINMKNYWKNIIIIFFDREIEKKKVEL